MTNTGGPAFPLHTPKWHELASQEGFVEEGNDFTMGMTLRDYFAAKAMAAAIAHHGIYDEGKQLAAMTSATAQGYHAEAVAKIAYTYADEMLAARGQQ